MLSGSLIFISCSKDSDDITGGTTGPQKISTGEWNASTDFGEFDFTVIDTDSTCIEEITINFDNWTIGGGTHNGSVTIKQIKPKWKISNRNFFISVDLDPSPSSTQRM
jgi:hypothetical protein